jgi:prolyl oligopeptidase
MDIRPTVDAPDDDPRLWLEAVEGEAALAWVRDQNARTLARFADDRFESDRDTLAALLDRPDRIPYVGRRAGLLYNFWQDAANPRGLWRRTDAAGFAADPPAWDVILDLDALARAEGEDWIWKGAATLPGTHDRAMLSLSRGGADAVVLREFDLTTRAFVAGGGVDGGFTAPEAKGGVAWLDRDTLVLTSALGGATTSGYARTVRLWRRGTDPADAPVIFSVAEDRLAAGAGVDRTVTPARIWFVDQIGFYDAIGWLGDATGPRTRIDLPTDAAWTVHGDWLTVKPRTPWAIGGGTVGGSTIGADVLVAGRLSAFLAGERRFDTLFEPGERRVLRSWFWARDRLILSILDDLAPVTRALTPSDAGWRREAVPGLPAIGTVTVWSFDTEASEATGELLADAQDPLTPATLWCIPPGGAPTVLRRAPAAFDATGLVVTRHEAVSVDGVRIPYVQVGPRGETGDAPVHMYGYGGFRVSELPTYRTAIGKLWLERGGTAVVANIRGGGEFGTPWHEAGRNAGKFLSHEDFAAVAADLVARGITRPGRIAAEGGSNGGILITNMLVRHPGRFGALFCTIPLIDMRRYTKLLAGASWIAEYGDPDRPADWDWLKTYSAYHIAQPGRPYPPILIATTRRDDRVHPGHARKMAAKLQDLGYAAHYHEPEAGGHGYGKDNRERAAFTALGYAFLRRAIGWEA